MVAMKDILKPGRRVRIVRQMPQRDQCWTSSVEGTLVSYRQEPTGAWFAHSKNHRLWLDRAMMRMDDGQLTDCVLDNYTRIEPLDIAATVAPATTSSVPGSARPNHARKWRVAAAFVSVLALGTFALAAVMMPIRLVAIGALCFFFLALWMSSPVLIAVINTAGHQFGAVIARLGREDHRPTAKAESGPLRTRASPGAVRPRAAHRSAVFYYSQAVPQSHKDSCHEWTQRCHHHTRLRETARPRAIAAIAFLRSNDWAGERPEARQGRRAHARWAEVSSR